MYCFIKRFFDLFFGILVLVIISPFLALISLILLLTGEHEIFYFQERIGYRNSKFFIIKFATMLKNSINMGSGSITLKDDFRVTSFGKILRKTKVNELPQIINIIKGDISIVGPRPLVLDTFEAYPEQIKENIYKTKPGLTGVGSIIFRDEESLINKYGKSNPHKYYKEIIAPFKGDLEMWYKANISFTTDLKLILLTANVVLFPNSKIHYKILKNLPKRKF